MRQYIYQSDTCVTPHCGITVDILYPVPEILDIKQNIEFMGHTVEDTLL
jgi:hypothetical protein